MDGADDLNNLRRVAQQPRQRDYVLADRDRGRVEVLRDVAEAGVDARVVWRAGEAADREQLVLPPPASNNVESVTLLIWAKISVHGKFGSLYRCLKVPIPDGKVLPLYEICRRMCLADGVPVPSSRAIT